MRERVFALAAIWLSLATMGLAASVEDLLKAEMAGTVEFSRLDDTWSFRADGEKEWQDVSISPAGWGMAGFADYRGWASCQQKLQVPEEAAARKHCYILFPAVDEEAEVYVNNKKVCEHTIKGTGIAPGLLWNTPFACDAKPFFKEGGGQELRLRILAHTNSGGIRKPVFLIGCDVEVDAKTLHAFMVTKGIPKHGRPKPDRLKEIKRDYELADIKPLPVAPHASLFGSRIQRTMSLIATSSPMLRRRAKILFYGQSVSLGCPWREIVNSLRRRYPWSIIEARNPSIGGFKADRLVRVANYDLYPYYPDLVLFCDSGGERGGEYERILYHIRKYTTAEIVIWTYPVPSMGAGKGTDGQGWNADSTAYEERRAAYRRFMAQKHGCELIDVREEWKAYLKMHKIPGNALMGDGVHPNVHPSTEGYAVLAKILLRHLRFNPHAAGGWTNTIRTYDVCRPLNEGVDEVRFTGAPWQPSSWGGMIGTKPDSALRFAFTGNRLDIIPLPCSSIGTAKILVDGKAPSQFAGAYACTRVSQSVGCRYPALLRVRLSQTPVPRAEQWTMRITDIDLKAKSFKFSLTGSVTGEDGTGSSDTSFVSKSGRIRIDKSDYFICFGALKYRHDKKPADAPFDVTWRVVPLSLDVWRVPVLPRNVEDRVTVIQGIKCGEHTVEIIPNGDGNVPIRSLVVHRPPLSQP